MSYRIIQGDNRETLKTIPDNSIDAIVTDPPYGIDFLGKAWDVNTGELETYQECLRVLKPGGHIVAFSAARTYHHLAMTLERAGFEIRDQIMWIYSSGFPKSQDVGKSIERTNEKKGLNNSSAEWTGWGTSLKPAHEPIALARKPIKLSIAKNVQKWGTGAINIDACRVPYQDQKDIDTYLNNKRGPMERSSDKDGENIKMFQGETGFKTVKRKVTVEQDLPDLGRFPSNVLGELEEGYQKYFYCPKVSRRERHMGHEMPPALFGSNQGAFDENGQRYAVELDKRTGNVGNNHPTVKPVELMKYLIKLITPSGGTVLDPFNGSGSTGMAAVELGYDYIGCELDAKYVEISEKRIEAWISNGNNFDDLFEE